MHLHDIAWAGLKRRRGRFGFIVAAVVLAIGTVVALVSLTVAMRSEVSDELDRFGANIVVTPRSRAVELAYGNLPVGGLNVDARELSPADAARIRSIPNKRNISAVAPKLVGTAVIDETAVMILGVVFRQERGIKSWWSLDGEFPSAAEEVLLGAEAASALRKRPGDTISLKGHPLRVSGVLASSGSIDDQALIGDLEVVQQALGRHGVISYIEVSALCRGCPIEEIVSQIAAVLPHARVAPIRQAVAARERAVKHFGRLSYALSALVLLVGILVVMTTMLSSVTERTQEIGILRAVGFRSRHVATVILLETLVVTVAGGTLGWATGWTVARTFGPALAQLSSPVPLDPTLAVAALALSVVVGVIGGVYPALRAARMDPARALRQI